jgi:hypothetical protein
MNWLFRIGIILSILSILSILVNYSRKHPPSSQVMLDPVFVAQIILANTTSRAGTVDKAPSVHIDPDVRGPFLFDFEEHQVPGAQIAALYLLSQLVLIIGLPGEGQAVLPKDPLDVPGAIITASRGASAGAIADSELASGGLEERRRIDGLERGLELPARAASVLRRDQRRQPQDEDQS